MSQWRPKKRVYNLPNGKTRTVWIARYKDRHGQIRTAQPAWNGRKGTFELRRDAQRAIDEAVLQPVRDRQDTVGGYFKVWLDRHPRSVRTEKTYAGHITVALDVEIEGLVLRGWDMRDLRRRHTYELVDHMLCDQGRAPGGARAILRTLSAMFEDAITDDICELNPITNVRVRDDDRRARKAPRELRVYSFEELHRFAACAGRWEPAIRVLSDCGLRLGEMFALRRDGLENGSLRVSGATWEGMMVESSGNKNHQRTVPVPPGCYELLMAMPPRIDTPLLFPTDHGQVWRASNWRRQVWIPTCERAGINPTAHELRHSYVSNLRAAGVDPADLADVAGHSMQTASVHYTHSLGQSFEAIRSAVP